MGYSSQQRETGIKVEKDVLGSDMSGHIHNKSNNNSKPTNTKFDVNDSSVEKDSKHPSHMFQCPKLAVFCEVN